MIWFPLPALVALLGPCFAHSGVTTVHMRVHADQRSVARGIALSFGDAPTFDAKSHEFTYRLRAGLNPQNAIANLNRRREVDRAWAGGVNSAPLESDLRSVDGVEARIEQIRANSKGEDEEPPTEVKHQEAGTDYLESLEAFLRIRAYPYSKVDWSAYDRAVRYVKTMHPAVGSNGGSPESGSKENAITTQRFPNWAYVGPNNLASIHATYYGPSPLSGRVNALAVDPNNPNTVFSGAGQGGLWKSTNGGQTWHAMTDGWPYLSVSTINFDPTNDHTIYVGTGDYQGRLPYCFGIMKSTDGGNTWTNYGQSAFGAQAVSALTVDPDNPSIVNVTTGRGQDDFGYVWRSTDGGMTWSQPLGVSGNWDCLCYGLSNGTYRNYYAVVGGLDPAMYISQNRGQTWTQLTNAPFTPDASHGKTYEGDYLAASAINPNTVYFLDSLDMEIYKSTDAGNTWTNITNNFPFWNSVSTNYNWGQYFYDYCINVIPYNGNDDIIVGLIDLDESQDGGSTWQSIGNTPTTSAVTHNDQHGFAAVSGNSNVFYFGNDGGVYRAVRSGSGWSVSDLNASLGLTMFYNTQWHPTDPTQIIGGTQDNATAVSLGNLNSWSDVVGGDGFWCTIKPDNPLIQAGTFHDLNIFLTQNNWADGGTNISYYTTQSGTKTYWNGEKTIRDSKIFQDQVITKVIFACTKNYLWYYSLQNSQWHSDAGGHMLTATSKGDMTYVAVAPSNGQVIYTGSDDAELEVSLDGAGSFNPVANISTGLPNAAITSISVDPNNPDTLIVGFSGTGTGHLYRIDNANTTTPVFSDLDGVQTGWTLPDVPLDCFARDPYFPKTFYVGTDIGLFRSTDAGGHWANMTQPRGLPNAQVTSIDANGSTGILSCATYGRGIWQMPLGSTYLISPGKYAIDRGKVLSGNLTSLVKSDGNVLAIDSAMNLQHLQELQLETDFTVPLTNGSAAALTLTLDTSATSNETETVYAYNFATKEWVKATSYATSTELTTHTFQIPGSAANFVRSSDGSVQIEIQMEKNSAQSQDFEGRFDEVQLKAVTSY